MKVSIEGFNQKYAMSLRATVPNRDKEKLIKIDCTDLVILRWFVDFYPNMKKMVVDGREYAWLSHKKIMEDLPLIDISKRGFSERLQKLVEFKILTYKLIKEGGTFTIYGFGENYINLVKDSTNSSSSNAEGSNSNAEGSRSNNIGGSRSNNIGVVAQTATKDKTINNKTINNNIMSEAKAPDIYVIDLPTNRFNTVKECYYVTDEFLNTMIELYPNANVLEELKKMKAWLLTNTSKRKTIKGMEKFINSWLSRAQDNLSFNQFNSSKKNNDGWDYLNEEFKKIQHKKEPMPF